MHRFYSAIALSLLLTACAASDEGKSTASSGAPEATKPVTGGEDPGTTAEAPPTETVPTAEIKASIASVQLKQNCPDPKKQAKADDLGAKGDRSASMVDPNFGKKAKAKRKPGSGPMVQPCSQSTVQLSFVGEVKAATQVEVKEVRLMSAEGKALGTLAMRLPSVWKADGYQAWDSMLSAGSETQGSETKTSYKLSVPNWGDLETALGGTSFGVMYILEVDVEVGGKMSTLRSPQFERGRPQIVKT